MSVVGSRLYPNPGLLSSGDGNGRVCMPVSTLYGPGRPRPHGSTDGLCVTCDRHTDEHKDSPGDMTRSPPVGLPLPYQHVPQLLLSLQAHTSLLKWLSRAQFPVPTVPTLKSWSLPKGLGNGTWVTSWREWGGGRGVFQAHLQIYQTISKNSCQPNSATWRRESAVTLLPGGQQHVTTCGQGHAEAPLSEGRPARGLGPEHTHPPFPWAWQY